MDERRDKTLVWVGGFRDLERETRWTLWNLSKDRNRSVTVPVMPVREHEELRDAAQAVLDTLDRSSSFSVNQVDRLRAALDLAENRGEQR